ncbi:hypothetical protein ACPYPG_06975 [Streptomyces sp. FR-108]|uniref:hypothetical protein n=1 Tax=Streptomyces sp. FR-108 TaxID=3416665 RepID=UPI003CF40500
MTSTRAAARKTSTGTKVYIHTGCACSRVNGKVIADVTTVDQAEAYAAEQGYATTFCKTSTVTAEAAPAPVEETAAPAEEPDEAVDFSVELDNRDQFGKQRREAVIGIIQALGGEYMYTSVKNHHKTGNDAFIITTTGPAAWERTVRQWLAATEAELVTVVATAKAESKAMEGVTANDRQKAWKRAAREFITAAGQRAAEELTGR